MKRLYISMPPDLTMMVEEALEAVDRVARYLGYPTENARLRIVRMAKNRPVRAHGRTAEGWSVGWSVSPASVAGCAIDLDSDALGPPHFSGEVINDVKLQRARTIEAIKTLLPPDGTSIRALTERINELPEFKDNRVGEDTVERALEDLEALCVQPPSVREVSSTFASVRQRSRGLARLNVPSANTRKR
jgi:hypothetical protein